MKPKVTQRRFRCAICQNGRNGDRVIVYQPIGFRAHKECAWNMLHRSEQADEEAREAAKEHALQGRVVAALRKAKVIK